MKYLPALAATCLLIVPSVLTAQQISPNPNPVGHTIKVDTTGAFNSVDFSNLGTIDITNAGTLSNRGALNNYVGTLNNFGTLNQSNGSSLTNYGGTLNNGGSLTNS